MRLAPHILASLCALSLAGCGSTPEPSRTSHSCPDWSSNPIHNYENTDFSNFGCAYYNNIAVQVENPDDLKQGHGQSMGEGDRESVNIQKYNSAVVQTVPSLSTSTSAGGSSR